jgi:hypothetical protein
MKIKATLAIAFTLGGLLTSTAAAGPSSDSSESGFNATAESHRARGPSVEIEDARGDVAKPKLDIQQVSVVNTPDQLKVRVHFPGVAKTYDFPLGYVSVWLDTDAGRKGPEFGHFMQFWSDYRFAQTRGWRELLSPEWSHSPDGRCVEYAGLTSDKRSRLRWFEYIVKKTDGCFEADAVRVAVSSVNEGENLPYRPYPHPYADHLGKQHSWSDWIPVS